MEARTQSAYWAEGVTQTSIKRMREIPPGMPPPQGSVFSFARALSTPPTSAQADTTRIRDIGRRLRNLRVFSQSYRSAHQTTPFALLQCESHHASV